MIRSSIARGVSFLAAALLVVQPCFSFQAPLSDQSVREAYFLGQRNDNSTLSFFNPYIHRFERPKTGPFVSEAEVYTPFVQVVETSRLRAGNYSAQQASLDYRRGTDSIFVRVRIDFTPTYAPPDFLATLVLPDGRPLPPVQRPNFARDFRIGLSQNDKWIEPLNTNHDLTDTNGLGHFPFDPDGYYSRSRPGPYSTGYVLTGWLVWLEFDAKDVASDSATVEIFGPGDQHLIAAFDLAKLR